MDQGLGDQITRPYLSHHLYRPWCNCQQQGPVGAQGSCDCQAITSEAGVTSWKLLLCWWLPSVFIIFKFYLLLLVVLLLIRASMQTGTDFRPPDVANCRGNFGAHPLQNRLPPACLHACTHGLCICVECYNAWQEGTGHFHSAWSQWHITDCYEQPLCY